MNDKIGVSPTLITINITVYAKWFFVNHLNMLMPSYVSFSCRPFLPWSVVYLPTLAQLPREHWIMSFIILSYLTITNGKIEIHDVSNVNAWISPSNDGSDVNLYRKNDAFWSRIARRLSFFIRITPELAGCKLFSAGLESSIWPSFSQFHPYAVYPSIYYNLGGKFVIHYPVR